jgi:oxygen-independent coproporphyrinogen-3 oxidase
VILRVGLYVHVPFCNFLCHYCDFAKTANFDSTLVRDYFGALELQLRAFVSHLEALSGRSLTFSSIYFGGGTPGIFTAQYRDLFKLISPRMDHETEVTLECNPSNISGHSLGIWRELGFNRLSVGVQTLQERGLKALTRDHDVLTSLRGLELALEQFPNLNMDLIYGWPGQKLTDWEADLQGLVRTGVPHASLYSLTFEERTPFGRMAKRGKLRPERDDALVFDYEKAREILGCSGFEHDEVSNWSRPGFTCHHNWLYWDFKPFIGIGAGAHGFLPSSGKSLNKDVDIGVRWSFARDVRSFLRQMPGVIRDWTEASNSVQDIILELGGELDEIRDRDAALIEYVGGSLRTRRGVDISFAELIMGRRFTVRPAIDQALKTGLAWFDGPRLRFSPGEWFRENSWAGEVLMGF